MKRSLLILLLTSGLAYADQNNPTKDELLQTVRHIQSLAKDLQSNLDKEKAAHAEVAAALVNAQKENTTLQSQINALTDKANRAIADHDKVMKKYHFLKWIASFIAAGVAVLIVLQLRPLIPPPFNLYAMGGAGAGAAALVWLFL